MVLKRYLESKLTQRGGVRGIRKIRGEASNRVFFRVFFTNTLKKHAKKQAFEMTPQTWEKDLPCKRVGVPPHFERYSRVAMVYPEENKEEIQRIVRLTDLYKKHGLKVPEIEEIIDNRIILEQDLGDVLVQTAFSRFKADQRKKTLERIAEMVVTLSRVSASQTAAVLDTARMKWEMDFFVTHFARNYCAPSLDPENLRQRLHAVVERIGPIDTFAHRDFHSRNMLYHEGDIFLVDFQDSLVAPVYYDLVSFAFDAYLDLKSLRSFFLDACKERGMMVDEEQFFLTALQRNIKALGTFGFQVMEKRNLSYKKYINRTLRHVLSNPLFDRCLDRSLLISLTINH